MSTPPTMNPYDGPQTPPPGMSGGAKVLLGLGIGCGVLVLLCCGGMLIGGFFFGRGLQQAMSEDPETIRRVTGEIVTIEIPEALPPQFSLDYQIPFVGSAVKMVIYADQPLDDDSGTSGSFLVLFQMDEELGNSATIRSRFENTMREAGREEWEEAELTESEEFKTTISGEEATFELGSGKRRDDSHEIWQVTGTFSGKGGPAMLFMQLDAEHFTKEDTLEILKSMH